MIALWGKVVRAVGELCCRKLLYDSRVDGMRYVAKRIGVHLAHERSVSQCRRHHVRPRLSNGGTGGQHLPRQMRGHIM